MLEGRFSRTAISTAAMRAVHQYVDGASVLSDPLAVSALSPEDGEALRRAADPVLRPLRLFVALRSRIAEDAALRAVEAGARQIVVLGAGLDTFAHRAPAVPGLKIFEIDHIATQTEKRSRFARHLLAPPPHLVYVPCDFESQTLAQALTESGYDGNGRTAFLWLGVVPYLTLDAVEATLRFIAARPGGADVVFDYANPPDAIEAAPMRQFHEEVGARVAAVGEPFRSHFDTAELHRRLREIGFDGVDDFGPLRIAERLGATPPGQDAGGHILHAWAGRDAS